MAAPVRPLNVLELYSGIGGMHFALKGTNLQYKVIAAADINTNANKVYKQNFPDVSIIGSAIESITLEKFEALKVDMILMSPPCQPFTRVGKQKDIEDPRSQSFLHVLELIKKAEKCPQYLLVENVKGFEVSESRTRLIQTLKLRNYAYQEFLLTPLQFGIPNSRLRYFLTAKLFPLQFAFDTTGQIKTELPNFALKLLKHKHMAEEELAKETQKQEVDHHGNIKAPRCACGGYSADGNIDSKTGAKVKHSKREVCLELDVEDKITPAGLCSESDSDCGRQTKRQKLDLNHSNVITTENAESNDQTFDSLNAHLNQSADNALASSPKDYAGSTKQYYEDKGAECVHSSTMHLCLQTAGRNLRQNEFEDPESQRPCLKLHHFLERGYSKRETFQDYLLKDKDFKRFIIMDIVNPCTRKSNCFTKRYGHYIEGAGSLVQMCQNVQVIKKASCLKEVTIATQNRGSWGEVEMTTVRDMELRYFTPREIANILCFPEEFEFPGDLTTRQKYMLLGNSLNVSMVTVLLQILTEEKEDCST